MFYYIYKKNNIIIKNNNIKHVPRARMPAKIFVYIYLLLTPTSTILDMYYLIPLFTDKHTQVREVR